MLLRIVAHELAEHLGGRAVLFPADLNEALSQLPINPYPEPRIFHHAGSAASGYTSEQVKVVILYGFTWSCCRRFGNGSAA